MIRDLDAADAIVSMVSDRDGKADENEGIDREIYQLNQELGGLDDFAPWTSAAGDSPPTVMEEIVLARSFATRSASIA